MSNQSIHAIKTDQIERYWIRLWVETNELTVNQVLRRLEDYGLKMYEVKLIYYRAIKDMPFNDLIKKQGWVSRRSAQHHYQKALKKLRDAGFKFK